MTTHNEYAIRIYIQNSYRLIEGNEHGCWTDKEFYADNWTQEYIRIDKYNELKKKVEELEADAHIELCGVEDCELPVTCGTPVKIGPYRTTCREHQPDQSEWK